MSNNYKTACKSKQDKSRINKIEKKPELRRSSQLRNDSKMTDPYPKVYSYHDLYHKDAKNRNEYGSLVPTRHHKLIKLK